MLIGYARVSKADGSQTTDLQRDALLAAGVRPDYLGSARDICKLLSLLAG